MRDLDRAFLIGTIVVTLAFLGLMGFSTWSDNQVKRECIAAGMTWQDGDCVPKSVPS